MLLLPIIGGVFVIETVSVIAPGRQLPPVRPARSSAWRRSTTTSSSAGWPETTVIIRFWIVAGLFTALALGLYYADFVSLPGVLD